MNLAVDEWVEVFDRKVPLHIDRQARVELLNSNFNYNSCYILLLACSVSFEGIVHLDDLLLRRVRLGLLLPNGGLDLIDRIRPIVQPELEWEDERWDQELKEYTQLWKKCYDFEH